jgi:PKD repeat protein
MRKLYAFLTGIFFVLVACQSSLAQTIPAADLANFTFAVNADNNDVAFTNTSIIGSEPGTRRSFWSFGDGTGQWTLPLANTQHHYNIAGTYTVCLKIFRYRSNTNDSVLSAQVCKVVEIPVRCRADFERVPVTASTLLTVGFKALPWNNANKKPARICWTFGDGRDTCIQYPENYTGLYTVAHHYNQPGTYEVCVRILYYGGCEARKCENITIERPDECRADFEKLPLTTSNSLLHAVFKALPTHNNNKKPARICWTFGDGRDTCINYTNSYTGLYTVAHRYNNAGVFEVCVKILYYGGCEARKCKPVQIGPRPDSCSADFERIPVIEINDPLKTAFKALPGHNNNKKPKTVCWQFGDGRDTCINYPENYTGTYTVRHRYNNAGVYEVCVKILYYGGCEARKCKEIRVGHPATCTADFERVLTSNTTPLTVALKALPWNSQNRKPARICWTFGDGQDTCINYPEIYTGLYGVVHRYANAGNYEVCIKILYYGGCEARNCKNILVGHLATCAADFERAPIQDNNPLTIALKALPSNSQNRKPARICWSFGDGRDTCINYPENYTGLYLVGHRYLQPGQYEVCVKILYYGGCEARNCKNITIPPPTVECRVRLFEITPSITSLVRGFYANASSNPERRIERICWYFGDGDDTCIMITPTTPNPIPGLIIRHTYPGPGVYRACVKIKFVGGCEADDCKEVVIRPLGDICGGYMTDSLAGPRAYKFTGHSINRPNDEVIGYRWTFGDGTSATGQVVTHTYTQAGDFEVCLYIKTRLGCETRICNTIRVPGNNEPQLHLAPNPVISTVTVGFRSTHTETVNIRIVNSSGLPVRTFTRSVTVGPNTWTHDLTTLPTGVYSYNVQSPNQQASVIFLKN